MARANVLEVSDLRTYFMLDEGTLKAIDGVDLSISAGQTMGVIGESGCGKSVTAQSIMRIIPAPGRLMSGRILFRRDGQDTVDLAALPGRGETIRSIRGNEIAMIFQEPMTSLSPVHTIGAQIMEAILVHKTPDEKEARELAMDMVSRVGISNPSQRMDEYPHQLSGGMRQRAMIAMALMCHPKLLIADEPTTALDVTVQAQILELMKELQVQMGMAMMYITHDLGVIAEIAEEVNVMYLGKVVERASAVSLFRNALHPYTRGLLKSIPRVSNRRGRVRLEAIKGNVPVPIDPPLQCGFYGRCPNGMRGTCDIHVPALVEIEPGHSVRCFLHSQQIERQAEPVIGRAEGNQE